MIYFLYGPDTYRSKQKLKEIVNGYKEVHKSGLNLNYLDCKESSFQDFNDRTKQASMFQEKKLIVVTNAFSSSEFKEHFLSRVEDIKKSDNIVVVYEREKISKKDSLLKSLKKHAESQLFELLEGPRLRNWIRREFKERGAKIESRGVFMLADFVGQDLWRMNNEIQKLIDFRGQTTIRTRDVRLLVRPDVEADIFKTIDAIASKNKKKALKLIKDHLEKGDNAFYLLSMVNYQFRNLLQVKDLLLRNKSPFKHTRLHPFVVKKSEALSRKFNMQELKKIYQKIFEVDLKAKTGRINGQAALDVLIGEI